MEIVFHFRTFSHHESEAFENVVDLVSHYRERVTRTVHGVDRQTEVEVGLTLALGLKLFLLLINDVLNSVFQLVKAHSHFFAHLWSHLFELGEKLGDSAFFAKILDTELLQRLFAVGMERLNFLKYFFYFLFHFTISIEIIVTGSTGTSM